MSEHGLIDAGIVTATVLLMECVAAGVHRYVMHGLGWRLHRSHHAPHSGKFEFNDLYAVLFSLLSILFFALGARSTPLWWVGLGMVVYGISYALLHDCLVHRRLPFFPAPRDGYLKRLVQAHRLHHATRTRKGAVSFGFLYAPPVKDLVEDLRSLKRRAPCAKLSSAQD